MSDEVIETGAEAQTTIDQLFEPETETVETTETETESTGETPEAAAEGEETATPAVESTTDEAGNEEGDPPKESSEVAGLKAALAAERKKRQELEEKGKETPKLPDPVDDPEGYSAAVNDAVQREMLNARITLSRDLMMDSTPDFTEHEKVFVEMAQANPSLVAQMHASPNPAKFAYQTAKDHIEVQKLRDPNHLQKLIEEKAKELIASQSLGKKTALDVPDLKSAAGKNDVEVEKPAGLKEIFDGAPL